MHSSTRELFRSGTLARDIADSGISGLTSNRTIFELAIGTSKAYCASIQVLDDAGVSDAAVVLARLMI